MVGVAPIVSTRDQFKAFVLRNLGGGVHRIEITNDQLEDAIDMAVKEFVPRAHDGVEKRFKVLDLTTGVHEYTVAYNTYAVLGVHQSDFLDYSPAPSDLFSINQYIANDLMTGGLGRMDLLTLELVQEQISTLGIMFGKRIEFNYNTITKKIFLHSDPTLDPSLRGWQGSNPCRVFLEYYKTVDYDRSSNAQQYIYDVKWVQQYAVALARKQYAINLTKYEGSVLPNGLTLNVAAIRDLADKEIETLMTQLKEEWELPVDFMIG